jgi:phage-related protein
MLNGFAKKTQKTPRAEIGLAKERMKEVMSHE